MKTEKEIVNIEEYAKKEKTPPKENVVYHFRVGKAQLSHDEAEITGQEILEKAGLESSQNRLYQKIQGGQRVPITPDQTVDLSLPGLERFETIPLDPTEG